MFKFVPLLFFALLSFQGCNLQDTPKPTSDDAQVSSSQSLGRVAADSATLHQVADDKTAGQNRPIPGIFRDAETGDKYQLNTGWHVVARQSKVGASALAKTSGLIQTWIDASGQVETRVYECVTPTAAQHQSIACQVETGFVAVGGGAYVDYGSGAGALLWESRIADGGSGYNPFLTWLASSKDHNYPCPHILHAYVIGIRLKDIYGGYIDPALLRNIFQLHKYTSSPATHFPNLNINISATALSAGARTNWSGAGSLLYASGTSIQATSIPQSVLYASGKDHIVSDPSTISLYSIDIPYNAGGGDNPSGTWNNLNLSNFGSLGFFSAQCDGSSVGTGVAVTYCDVPQGGVLIGLGGVAYWTSGTGRMLFGIKPTGTYNGQIAIYSKDHRSVSAGYNHANLIWAEKW